MLRKVTFDEQVNVLERYCKGIVKVIYKTLMALIPKSKVLKGLVLRSVTSQQNNFVTVILFSISIILVLPLARKSVNSGK